MAFIFTDDERFPVIIGAAPPAAENETRKLARQAIEKYKRTLARKELQEKAKVRIFGK